MKHPVIALMLQKGRVKVDGIESPLRLPDGCVGLCFAFESKKAARAYWGNDIDFVRIEKKEAT